MARIKASAMRTLAGKHRSPASLALWARTGRPLQRPPSPRHKRPKPSGWLDPEAVWW